MRLLIISLPVLPASCNCKISSFDNRWDVPSSVMERLSQPLSSPFKSFHGSISSVSFKVKEPLLPGKGIISKVLQNDCFSMSERKHYITFQCFPPSLFNCHMYYLPFFIFFGLGLYKYYLHHESILLSSWKTKMNYHNEFQAIVLAGGKGSRMTELTAGQPKCLLPIANVPMIWYPLQILERSGFKEAIVVIAEATKSDVLASLDKLGLKIKIEFVGIPGTEDLGTADSIRLIHEKIYTDILVISCDLITNVDLLEILNLYRKHNASVTALMLPISKMPDDFVMPGLKNKQKPETDLIGIDNNTGRLVFLASASDFEETINISQRLLRKHASFTIHSKLMDAHLYIINKWVIDFLIYNKNFTTLKGELLPYIVGKQLSRPKQSIDDKTSMVQMDLKDDIFHFALEKPFDELIRKMSAFNDHSTDLEDAYNGDVIRCYAHVSNEKFGLRANTIQMYHLANAKISEWWNDKNINQLPLLPYISSTATVRSTQMQECRIGDNSLIEEKTSLKNNHIGPNSIVESKTRISQSVIMGHVTIKQRCVIHNCILCNGCIIEEGTELKNCVVGAQHIVKSGSQHSHEVLTDADRLIEI
ncbi:Translation initiation factor eIF-2B subunit gamma [Atta colombica]|uniref:Translation initiation factor eIF2B subunit gamma n=2 Tax=Atta colombica TaxID=520822 RepID=A0A195BD61_9HYME|nr:Translation initiation factor eIF-2B subunit gamma [Atta colombica]